MKLAQSSTFSGMLSMSACQPYLSGISLSTATPKPAEWVLLEGQICAFCITRVGQEGAMRSRARRWARCCDEATWPEVAAPLPARLPPQICRDRSLPLLCLLRTGRATLPQTWTHRCRIRQRHWTTMLRQCMRRSCSRSSRSTGPFFCCSSLNPAWGCMQPCQTIITNSEMKPLSGPHSSLTQAWRSDLRC